MSRNPFLVHGRHSLSELKVYLDEINVRVEQPGYIEHDPVQFIHAFSDKKDIEIAGFFASVMAWGRRDIVIAKVNDLLKRMQYRPLDFILNYHQRDFQVWDGFKHRTLKPIDVHAFVFILQQIFLTYEDFEHFWAECHAIAVSVRRPMIAIFRERFFQLYPETPARTFKHLSNPENGSACKRLYMFLRWMVRKNSPVDLGIWNFMSASELIIPMDVHVARQSRKYGLLSRKSTDWLAVQELTTRCRHMNPDDPAIYDFSLFGLGALGYQLPEKFILNRNV